MSDPTLRELARRWRQTGAAPDEAAYLLARVRVGDLTEAALALAARLGHSAARLATDPDPTLESRLDLRDVLRVALQAARSVRHVWASSHDDEVEFVAEALAAAEAAVACPCPVHEEAAALAAGRAEGAAGAPVRLGYVSRSDPAFNAGKAAGAAAEAASRFAEGAPDEARAEALRALEHAAQATSPEQVTSALLSPTSLGQEGV